MTLIAIHRQRGAALVVGLILLAILTLLGVAGVNIARGQLVMAGNEQVRSRAFQAAETGVERAVSTAATDVAPGGPAFTSPVTAMPGSPVNPVTLQPTDSFQTETTYIDEDTQVTGFGATKFVRFHYTVQSTGTSSRNARMVDTQGLYWVNGSSGSDFSP
jgi:type II secretory pathway component PulK